MKSFALCIALLATGAIVKAQEPTAETTAARTIQSSAAQGASEPAPLVQKPVAAPQSRTADEPPPEALPARKRDAVSKLENLPPVNFLPRQRGEVAPLTSPPDAVDIEDSPDEDGESRRPDEHFHWLPAIKQSLLFLAVQHSYALTQPKTQRDLHGPFFRDYARSVKSLHGWGDGGRFFTNYIAHPMEGSLVGFIQIQNDPQGVRQRFGKSPAYWRSRLKAFGWTAAWSTQFEIGPISQASIGNVGLHGKQTYVDLVVTPTIGLGLLVAEDAIDQHLVAKIERHTDNLYLRITGRMILNPTRSIANLLRFKKPWYRDAGLR